jgi:capsid protein
VSKVGLRQRIARWIAGSKSVQRRTYASARPTRFNVGLGSSGNSSADAKRAKTVVIDNVIGSGINMQAQVKTSREGELFKRVNDDIEAAWGEWACGEYCHTGGVLHFADLERVAMGQVFEAGEVFIRLHRRAFGGSQIPLGLELVEAERVAHAPRLARCAWASRLTSTTAR